ncbi:LRR receptor-like serine/threonine-protein kinase FLS2 [Juglans microcarpa x Juglans regia]|uniref:LRR receptor-like serine/threonine-protein kinase FLS2 n=1 Tax=Juglans microcarpa x Juglans regia TaxID=2249226 RepID=UPI001B7E5770|nr:LRR receptor-like serine/threonine-protein kinase FLS2 [Juglans microcarpa x Juglans regia]XP_041021028.1 LRR receptor-like serine/threonine-protein kinase FLS2 [Juglans microcarpa x Juglans regia]
MECNQMIYITTAKILLILFVSRVLPSASASVCEDLTDCLALLKFKEAITSDPKSYLQDWNKANSLCNWTGITCHPHLEDRVIALELVNMGLQGTISPFLSNLSLLNTLSLCSNRFHGEIPTTLGRLSKLAYLNLSTNLLEGNIPPSLQGCQSLKIIDLNINNLSGIPKELGWMKNLTHLALSVNNLTGVIPSFLSNLTSLINLQLAVNFFTGKIPPQLGALAKMEILYLHTNFLEGTIPNSLSNCTALREISMVENLLSGDLPSELGDKLQNLQKLYLLDNKLSGEIPVTLTNLSHLTLLDLSVNNFSGEVPQELGKLKNLEILYLHTNNLGGRSGNPSFSFLTALTNCSFMKKLHLGSCLFTGNLPDSVGALSKELYYFNILNNRVTGEIPGSIGNLSGLVRLTLQYNFLDGRIPATLGKLWQLQTLVLGKNRLFGVIPEDMGNMTNLGSLDASDNLLSGSIPSTFGNLSQLRYLSLSQNHLSGNLPIELTRCSLMMLLDLSFNALQGSIPREISSFSKLSLSLNLSNNNFQGEVPSGIGQLVYVLAIDLSENRLSGAIPSLIGSCISLEHLNLSHNMLDGTIPEALKMITHLKVLDLAHNQLTGDFPIWITNGQFLMNLNLSYNSLTGEVPNTIRFNRSSFMGNLGLCGGSDLLGLPRCEAQKQKKKRNKKFFYVLAITLSCTLLFLVLVAVFVYRFFYKKETVNLSHSKLTSSPINFGNRTFTQRELEIATAEFDEANLLGRGSYGSVYKAIIDDGDSVVAVKVLHGESIQSLKNCKRECQILSGIKHRNLVRLIGSAWSSQFMAIVLEYVGNGNLEQHLYPNGLEIGSCNLKLRDRLGIAIDVAHGLEYLHEYCSDQVIHCDLKPQNVLLDTDMVAHVADFGVAKLILADKQREHVSTTDFLRGSIGYIPPEYGQGIEVSTRGDVYSFGIMLLEMMTGRKPTSELFSDRANLRNWVDSAFPDHIMDVLDNSLKREANSGDSSCALQRFEQCCVEMLDSGLICTQENPQKRPLMSSVAKRLKNIQKEQ